MNFVLDAVAGGFRIATRRLPLVLADLAGKFVWLLLTAVILFVSVISFLGQLAPATNLPPELGGLVVASQLSRSWPALFRTLLLAGGASFLVWSFVEAFIRSRIWRWTWRDDQDLSSTFGRFLASGLLRRSIFVLAAALMSLVVLGPGMAEAGGQWPLVSSGFQWSVVTAVFLLVLVAFVLMLVDTLMRCNAVEALGKHLGAIVGAVATIGLFEVIVRMGALAGTVVLMNMLPAPAVILLAVPAIGLGLSVLHSYLLLVRYSAIGIIQNHPQSRASTHNGSSYSL